MNNTDKTMMATIQRTIAAKAILPVETELMELIGARSATTIQDSMRRLRRKGVITVRTVKGRRVVSIVETGEETAEPETGPIRVAHDPEPPIKVEHMPRVNRDPCGFCGVRGDIGCRHQWREAA